MLSRFICSLMVLGALAWGDSPEVLVIDDFSAGLGNWENQDTGSLSVVDGAMCWTAADDGVGHIVYKALKEKGIRFSDYQLLSFRIKIEGKKAWNVNPVIQQYPAVYGYRGLYYSIDTLMPFGEWFEYTQDLRRWENAWPDTFSATAEEFQFEVAQLAGSGATQVYLDDIKLLKNPLGLERSYPGRHGVLEDGTQVTHFRIELANSGDKPLTVTAALRDDTLSTFSAELPRPVRLLPGERAEALVRLSATADALAKQPTWYGETAIVGFSVDGTDLTLYTELTAGSRPEVKHPMILANPERVKAWRKAWKDPESRAEMDKAFVHFVKRGEAALERVPVFPLLAHTGIFQCNKDNTRLVEIDVPTAPHNTYQCPTCGEAFSGPMFDAGMQKWLGEHLANSGNVRDLGFAYAITGEKRYALAAARILREYVRVYPQLPIMATSQGSPVFSHTSGATRIGGTYMRERTWLTALAVGLDFIRPAGVLTDDDVQAIAEEVFVPSGHLMMDHKVGAMNLQWMIASAGLFAGLATDHPNLVARSMYDSHGVINLMKVGYLEDGNWWENPSYQNVCNGIAFPVMTTCLHNGMMAWDARKEQIFSAAFKAYGPDGRGPTLGTGGPGSINYTVNGLYGLGPFLTNPELAWVPYNKRMWRATSGGGSPYDSYLWALTWQMPPALAQEKTVSPVPQETTHLSAYGGLAMRLPETDQYCYFYYGRELVHGHRNKLSINAYAKGGWYVRNVAGGYGDDFKDFLETIASSTSVMVDGKNADWDTGELLFQEVRDDLVLASGREVGAWKDVEHERSVVLTDGPLIVIDRLMGEAEHQYDWLYQSAGTKLDLVRDGLAEQTAPLGDTPHYGSLFPDRNFGDTHTASFLRKDKSGLTLATLPEGQLFAFKALKKKQIPGLLWRQSGTTVGFGAVYWPHAKDEATEATIERLPVTNAAGKTVDIAQGQAVRVSTPTGSYEVLVNYSGKPLTAGKVTSAKRVAAVKL